MTIDEKDLGVTIDNQLNFSMHVQTQVAKANRILGCLRHTFKYLTSPIFLQLYKAMIRPHLEYASCIWFPKLKRDSDAIERNSRSSNCLFTTHMQTSSQFRKPSSPLKPKHQKYITSHQCAPIGYTRQEVGSLHSLETTSHSLQQTYLRLLIYTT